MTLHDEKVLQAAEKLLCEETTKNQTFGLEIESVDTWILSDHWKAEYKKLYKKAKKQNPEIWECNAFNLPDEAYYNNKDFFELLYDIAQAEYLISIFPEKKEQIKKLFNNQFWKISSMYDFMYWYLKNHDSVIEFNRLERIINKQDKRG